MKLICDSGGTKAAWAIIDRDKVFRFDTDGISPFYSDQEFFDSAIKTSPYYEKLKEIDQINFYGTGCNYPEKQDQIREWIRPHTAKNAKILVEHDLYSACIATLGDSDGVCGIMGTGSNVCLYQNKSVIDINSGLGYILGDEGSGADIGKHILKDFLTDHMPATIQKYLSERFEVRKYEIFQNVYALPQPNKYLASWSIICSEFRNDDYVQNLLRDRFRAFIKRDFLRIPNIYAYPIGLVGSISFVFSDEMNQTLAEFDLSTTKIIKSPIEGLIEYFQQHP
ncbi:MAG: hypothetical protein MUE53_06660 [Chitinophagales bacterium]|jgi:N-acetylglucosamine kinase-like BadF-type ATPase|nr:hypothetical protein [Chitinophagales bacterium]